MKILLLSLLIYTTVLPANRQQAFTTITTTERSVLSDRKWEMQEIRFLYDNKQYYYNRDDRSASNMSFDNDHIIFKCDGTGIYHQGDNIEYKLKWNFKEEKENAIEFTISKFRNNSDLVVNWENIELSNNSIKYTEYYTHKNGLHCLGSGIRISKDPANTVTDITLR